MVIHSEYLTGSTVSGELSLNTHVTLAGIAREILVKPATSTTRYNITITNANSLDIFYSESITGKFAEEIALPIRGGYTVTIDSATKDEAFVVELMIVE